MWQRDGGAAVAARAGRLQVLIERGAQVQFFRAYFVRVDLVADEHGAPLFCVIAESILVRLVHSSGMSARGTDGGFRCEFVTADEGKRHVSGRFLVAVFGLGCWSLVLVLVMGCFLVAAGLVGFFGVVDWLLLVSGSGVMWVLAVLGFWVW